LTSARSVATLNPNEFLQAAGFVGLGAIPPLVKRVYEAVFLFRGCGAFGFATKTPLQSSTEARKRGKPELQEAAPSETGRFRVSLGIPGAFFGVFRGCLGEQCDRNS
jgi:hypothetical protein